MSHPGMRTSSLFNTHYVVRRCNRVAKRARYFVPNNVAICCAEILRSFGRSLQMMLRSFGRGFKQGDTKNKTFPANSIVLNVLGETHAFQRPIESSIDRYIKTWQRRRHVVCLWHWMRKKMVRVSAFILLVVLLSLIQNERSSGLPTKIQSNGE